jgi:hypothetical protein
MLGRRHGGDDSVAVLSVRYPGSGDHNNSAIRFYNEVKARGLVHQPEQGTRRKRYTPPEGARRFVEDYLLPLVATDVQVSGRATVSGTKLPVEEAQRNMRNLTLVGHSYGTQVVEQIGDALTGYMRQLGYEEAEIKDITRQVAVLAVGDVVPVEGSKNASFTTLHVMNEKDVTMELHVNRNNLLARKMLASGDAAGMKPLVVSSVAGENADHRWIAAARAIVPMRRMLRSDPMLMPDTDAHEFETHVMMGSPVPQRNLPVSEEGEQSKMYSNAFMLPTVAASFLRNAVDHSVRNHRSAEQDFTPLGAMPELLKCRDDATLAYGMSAAPEAEPYTKLAAMARGFGYQDRLEAATLTEAQRDKAVAASRQR